MKKPSIEQIDNFFPRDIAEFVAQYAGDAAYTYGERDNSPEDVLDVRDPTGLVHELYNLEHPDLFNRDIGKKGSPEDAKLVYECFIKGIGNKYPGFLDEYKVYRLYVNCFAPRELANFHQDCYEDADQYTFLYYPLHPLFEYDIVEGGCTEFYVDRKVIGTPPFPNSIVRFKSQLLHRATPFRSHHRFAYAIKFACNAEVDEFVNGKHG